MEAGEYGLTRVTCFLACRFELDAVSVWLWISWCVLGGGAGFFRFSFSDFFFLFERTRPAASMRPPCLIYLSTSTWVRTGCHYLISLSVCVCVTFVVFTDCESCTRPISTNPGSMEAGEYGLTRGARFIAVSLEVVAVAGLMWASWCVFGGAGFFYVFCFVFFHSNAHGLLKVRGHLASCTSLLVPGCVQGGNYLISLSVGMCVCVCVTFVVFTDCENCTRPISTNPGSMEAGEYGLTRGACFLACGL